MFNPELPIYHPYIINFKEFLKKQILRLNIKTIIIAYLFSFFFLFFFGLVAYRIPRPGIEPGLLAVKT